MLDALFTSGGTEVFFHRIADYGLAEIVAQIPDYDLTGGDNTFADLQRAAEARGKIAIRIRRARTGAQTPRRG